MKFYEITMKHSPATLRALSRMQYDIFAGKQRVVMKLMCAVSVGIGTLFYTRWWGVLLLIYGGFLLMGNYSYADVKSNKIIAQIEASGKGYPASRFEFEKDGLHIFSLPKDVELEEPLKYSMIVALGEDSSNFYIFKNTFGGYVIPKSGLKGEAKRFKEFIEQRSGKFFYTKHRSPLGQLSERMRRRSKEPYHL